MDKMSFKSSKTLDSFSGLHGESHSHAIDWDRMLTYEAYLDSFITPKDLFYLDSEERARTIVTLGYRIPELLSRDDFEDYRKAYQEAKNERKKDETLISRSINPSEIDCPLMQALVQREKKNRDGFLSTIIYIRGFNLKKQEVSGYLDYSSLLVQEEEKWQDYFTGNKLLLPRATDLSFYNWKTFFARCNSSNNYTIVTDVLQGLCFKNKIDRKVIILDPSKENLGDNTEKILISSPYYIQCFLLDHFMRVKS